MEPSSMPITGNAKIDHFFTIVGLVMSASSTAASVLNAKVRATLDAGDDVPRPFLYLALILNYAAFNIDKAAQLHKLLRGDIVVMTRVGLR